MSAAADIVWGFAADCLYTLGAYEAHALHWAQHAATTVPWGPLAIVTACAYTPAALLHAADRRRARRHAQHAEQAARPTGHRIDPHTAAALQQAITDRPEVGSTAWLQWLMAMPAHDRTAEEEPR